LIEESVFTGLEHHIIGQLKNGMKKRRVMRPGIEQMRDEK